MPVAHPQSLDRGCLGSRHRLRGTGTSIDLAQLVARFRHQPEKIGAALAAGFLAAQPGLVAGGAEPFPCAGGFDGNRESLVECGIALHIEPLVRQFMEDKAPG